MRDEGQNGSINLHDTKEYQRGRNDNINKICVLEGVGRGKITENCPKTLFSLQIS